MPVNPACAAIVLAAGAGSRMGSDLPKPLHPVAGREMVLRVLDAVDGVEAAPVVVVVGHGGDLVRAAVGDGVADPGRVVFTEQPERLGTGDAARIGLAALTVVGAAADDVLILPGDTPLLRAAMLARLVEERRRAGAAACLLTARVDDPTGYGRIVRSDGAEGTVAIVEQRDASPSEAALDEINAGVYCFDIDRLREVLPRLRQANAASEYYITDAIGMLARDGHAVSTVAADASDVMGVNNTEQLAACEAVLSSRLASLEASPDC